MKLSLWDLKPAIDKATKPLQEIMKLSLWDLKHSVSLLIAFHLSDYEAIPMGFETSQISDCNNIAVQL